MTPLNQKSVQSINQWQSLPVRQAGVIQTNYDSVKTHGVEIKVESNENMGTEFTVSISIKVNN